MKRGAATLLTALALALFAGSAPGRAAPRTNWHVMHTALTYAQCVAAGRRAMAAAGLAVASSKKGVTTARGGDVEATILCLYGGGARVGTVVIFAASTSQFGAVRAKLAIFDSITKSEAERR